MGRWMRSSWTVYERQSQKNLHPLKWPKEIRRGVERRSILLHLEVLFSRLFRAISRLKQHLVASSNFSCQRQPDPGANEEYQPTLEGNYTRPSTHCKLPTKDPSRGHSGRSCRPNLQIARIWTLKASYSGIGHSSFFLWAGKIGGRIQEVYTGRGRRDREKCAKTGYNG